MFVRSIAIAVLLLGFSAPAHAGDWEDMWAAYNRGDYAAAFPVFKRFADQGDARAQYNLGQMYKQGNGVTPDYVEAVQGIPFRISFCERERG